MKVNAKQRSSTHQMSSKNLHSHNPFPDIIGNKQQIIARYTPYEKQHQEGFKYDAFLGEFN